MYGEIMHSLQILFTIKRLKGKNQTTLYSLLNFSNECFVGYDTNNVSIYHECERGIEKSVPMITLTSLGLPSDD